MTRTVSYTCDVCGKPVLEPTGGTPGGLHVLFGVFDRDIDIPAWTVHFCSWECWRAYGLTRIQSR